MEYVDYGEALVECGRLLDSLDAYSVCSRLDRLVIAFMGLLRARGLGTQSPRLSALGCPLCDGVLVSPVTLSCGHTVCAGCVVRATRCVCGAAVPRAPGPPDTNVLVRTVVERWFAAELAAGRMRDDGNRLVQDGKFEEAVAQYTAAIDLAPSHQAYSNRSHTLYRLNRLQPALEDAEAAIRLRPHWVKGHYRKAVVMAALGQHEEAFVSFALCAALDLEHAQQTMRTDLTRSLKKLVGAPTSRHGQGRLCVKSRWSSPYFSPSHFLPTVNSSDCEDNSSGDDDFQDKRKNVPKAAVSRRLHKIFDRVFQEVTRLKKLERSPVELVIDTQAVDPSDFDCILCCRTLWRPVTTPCGHSYCSTCLERSLDYSPACPLCMTTLPGLGAHTKSVTVWLEEALKVGLPEVYSARLLAHHQEQEELARSPEVPVFVCTTAFPTVPCPLFVYEPRYRGMIRRCVEAGSGQFAISACVQQAKNSKRFADFGTMLKIEDCVLLPDGCSILTAVGVRRFQVLSRGEHDGYDTAQIKFLVDVPIHHHQLKEIEVLHSRVLNKGRCWFSQMPEPLREEIYRTFGRMPEPETDWSALDDGPAWLWWLLAILPLSKTLQIAILSITSLGKRLRAVEKTLDHLAQNSEATTPLGSSPAPPAPSTSVT